VPPTLAGAIHRGMSTWCLAPNSASEPNVRFLMVGRIARRRVQADRLPVPPTFASASHPCRFQSTSPVP